MLSWHDAGQVQRPGDRVSTAPVTIIDTAIVLFDLAG
jgi:hypothetical protein